MGCVKRPPAGPANRYTPPNVSFRDWLRPRLLEVTEAPEDVPQVHRCRALSLPIPDLGPQHEVVFYEANRLDDVVRFTEDACRQLTGIPKAFLTRALQGIIGAAKKEGVATIDLEFIQKLNAERSD